MPPVRPAFGHAADLGPDGLVRAYEWVDGRALADTDDVAAWLGGTLARLHRLAGAEDGGVPPEWYRLDDDRWAGWLAAGERRGKPWRRPYANASATCARSAPGWRPASTRPPTTSARTATWSRGTSWSPRLGDQPLGAEDRAAVEKRATEQIGGLPEFAGWVAGWPALLRAA